MEKYIGTKMVEAEKGTCVLYGGQNYFFPESAELTREDAKIIADGVAGRRNMYRVQYPDGYISYSPVAVFESAYRRTEHMNFGLAIEAAKQGKRIARRGWNGKSQYVELAAGISYINAHGESINAEHESIGNRALAFCGTSGVQLGWLASQADMLADDWYIKEREDDR